MVVPIKFLWSIISSPGLVKVPAPAPAEPAPFSVGDTIRLKPHDNPYKGALKCGKGYVVIAVHGDIIRLIADNGTNGYFRARHFELQTTLSADIAAEEYEQAILAQEIMEQQ